MNSLAWPCMPGLFRFATRAENVRMQEGAACEFDHYPPLPTALSQHGGSA